MTIFYYLCDCINAAVRAWLALQLADAIFEPKLTRKRIYIGQAFIIAFIAIVQFANSYLSHSIFSNAILFATIFVVSIASLVLYECTLWYTICLNILSWVSLALIDFFIQICGWLILEKVDAKKDALISVSIYRGFYLLICILLFIPIGISLRKWFSNKKTRISEFWKQANIIALFLLPCMIYFQRIYLQMDSEKLFRRWWIFFMGAALIFLAFGFSMLKQKMEDEKRMYQFEVQMLENSYEGVLKGYREKAILMHDVKNHLRTLHSMLDERPKEECQAYIMSLTGEIQKKWNAVWTNHKILDLVLNMKFQEAEEAQIKVWCQSDDLSELKLDSVEICALFANLLDNAVEANENCSEEIERKIEIICRRQGSILVISISNSTKDGMESSRRMFSETTKQDKAFHGFGMFSIENIIQNHCGHLEVKIQKNMVRVLIYLNGFEE